MFHYPYRPKRFIVLCAGLCLLYWSLHNSNQTIQTTAVFVNTKPIEAWEYVADFSNMKTLNPTIVDFNIISEGGNFDHWKYTVEYRENLSHWPYIANIAVASFDVKPEGSDYFINSTHSTCFLGGWYCLKSKSVFAFSYASGAGTRCVETITFQCPNLFTRFCRREAEYQRTLIMDNLRNYFNPAK